MAVLLFIVVVPLSGGEVSDGDPIVGTINGEPVTAGEYRLVMNRQVAHVYGYFKERYNLDDHADYWAYAQAGETPADKLRQLTLEELKRIKVHQALARKHGLITDTSFATLQQQWAQENERRRKALAAKEVIYGPSSYGLPAFYYVQLGDLIFKLKQKLGEQAAADIKDAQVGAFYAENKQNFQGKRLDEVRDRIIFALKSMEADRLCAAAMESAQMDVPSERIAHILPRTNTGSAPQTADASAP